MSGKLTSDAAMKNNLNAKYASSTDFSLFKYINTRTKSQYVCTIHNYVYEMLPTNFWGGHGCPKCAQTKRNKGSRKGYFLPIRKTNSQIIEEFRGIHGKTKYRYDKVNYTKNNIKVEIVCTKHGSFFQTPNKHLLGRGCPLCANETRYIFNKRTQSEFISAAKKTHKNFYDYSETNYRGALYSVDIICPNHGKFKQKANDHLNGHGCKYCAQTSNRIKLVKSNKEVIERAKEVHGDFYDYSEVDYTGIYNPITIICPYHKKFKQVANAHLNGSGCPKCNSSKGEKHIAKILDKHKILYKEQYKFQACKFKQPLP